MYASIVQLSDFTWEPWKNVFRGHIHSSLTKVVIQPEHAYRVVNSQLPPVLADHQTVLRKSSKNPHLCDLAIRGLGNHVSVPLIDVIKTAVTHLRGSATNRFASLRVKSRNE
jgi:hypothetical protein